MPENKTLIPKQWIADNYRFLESASIVLCAVSYLLRVFEVEGWGLAMVISFTFYASLIYLGAFLSHSYNQLITSVCIRVSGISGSVTLVGLMFAFLRFPGARSMLQIGSITLGISGLILFALVVSGKEKTIQPLLIRSLILCSLGVIHLFYFKSLM